jgi:hypothetical protein
MKTGMSAWVISGHRSASEQCLLYPQKADIPQRRHDVRFVPKADIAGQQLDVR